MASLFVRWPLKRGLLLGRSRPWSFSAPFYKQEQEVVASSCQIRGMANHRHKRLLKYSRGFRGRSKNCFSLAIRRVQKGWQYAFRDRKNKKRLWRTLWIQRIQAGVRQYRMSYSRFVHCMYHYNQIILNRKVLSELAAMEPFAFKAVVDVVQQQQADYERLSNAKTEEGDEEILHAA